MELSVGTIGQVTGLPLKQLYNVYDGVLEMEKDPVKGIQKIAGWTDFSLQGSTPKRKTSTSYKNIIWLLFLNRIYSFYLLHL